MALVKTGSCHALQLQVETALLQQPHSETPLIHCAQPRTACPVCASTRAQHLCIKEGYQVWRCAQCATDFVFPTPSKAALHAYYDREAWFEGGERGGYQNYDAQTEPLIPFFSAILDGFPRDGLSRSVLDVGCGYGTHLEQAYQRGWKCFGVEISAHARRVINQRHEHKFFIADDVDHLIPHEFDLIVMLDVIEHLADPWRLFYSLFAKGAITPQTTVVVVTPNARSASAATDPVGWAYRHPPSHLVYFSAQTLTTFLQQLRFRSILIEGRHVETDTANSGHAYLDEAFPINDELRRFSGLFCKASGSDFAAFMQERYVPGTWSKIAEYEHLPRYLFARNMVEGRKVLDFGCGTGYGAALIAQRAESVVGVDIDQSALDWAGTHHKRSNLSFERHSDLGGSMPAASFEVITCFEMIEHIAEELQVQVVRSFARLLTRDGVALISTPNPEITKLYGQNAFHIREMNRAEFEALLREHFEHVEFFKQYIQPSVHITSERGGGHSQIQPLSWNQTHSTDVDPAVFVAVCSHRPIPRLDDMCFLDMREDFIKAQLNVDEDLNRVRFNLLQATEQASDAKARADELESAARRAIQTEAELHRSNLKMAEFEAALHARNVKVVEVEAALHARNVKVVEVEAALHTQNLKVVEVEAALHTRNLKVVEVEAALHTQNLKVVEVEAALHRANLQVMQREARLLDFDMELQATKTELARYNWIRKIDRMLIRRKP